MSVATEALPVMPPVEKTRGYWRTVGRRLARDRLSVSYTHLTLPTIYSV